MTEVVRQRTPWGFGVFSLVMIAAFIGLGLWQLQRRVEKHALIAALTERLAAAPRPLPPASEWRKFTPDHDEFRRVRFTAIYETRLDAMVYSSGSAIRPDISGPGTWAFIPARLPGGETLAINAGFVPNTMMDRGVQVQGYLVSRPLKATSVPSFLTESRHHLEQLMRTAPAPNVDLDASATRLRTLRMPTTRPLTRPPRTTPSEEG